MEYESRLIIIKYMQLTIYDLLLRPHMPVGVSIDTQLLKGWLWNIDTTHTDLHCMCLSTGGLTVRKNGRIVAT